MKSKNLWKTILPIGICAVDFMIMAFFFYPKAQSGELLSVRHASKNLCGVFMQSMTVFLYPAALLILFAAFLRKDFIQQMYMTLEGKWQRITAGILLLTILGLTVWCLIVKEDKISVLFSLLYYSVFIAFAEEFLCRDVCTWFLQDFSWPVRYLIPNICFALLHIFSAANWGEITGDILLHFITSQALSLTVAGCLFQLLKEKSGTIWLPVLLHALMDFSIVLTY
ncbi:MAG: CPBP family intramembrane metalloprotease [Solobacterium sp.]|nr:CPBP family intramembrane metalloprotease [Solobacterium sp.]